MKTVSIICLLITSALFANDPLQSQTRPLPITVSCRESTFKGSYVLQIQNSSNEKLSLWLQAKGMTSPFLLSAGKMVEFGWAQGYKFDANNLFFIGGNGYDTTKGLMPNVELSPIRITLPKDGGIGLSISQYLLQDQLPKSLKLPIKEKYSNVFEVEINQFPRIKLIEGSDRIYINAILQASLFSTKVQIPIAVSISSIPFYAPATGEIGVTQIRVESIDINLLPKEYLDAITQIVNDILPFVFNKYVIVRLEKKWQLKIANFTSLRTRVDDGRLEILIL